MVYPPNHRIVLGIDPGTARTGYGVVENAGGKLTTLGYGLIEPRNRDRSAKLAAIAGEVQRVITEYNPTLGAIERLYFSKNKTTALAVAEARGVILATLAAAGVPIIELSPADAKAGVTGHGNADKAAVGRMVRGMLSLGEGNIIDDTLDALALAITASYGTGMRG